jgi:hypothetical protein
MKFLTSLSPSRIERQKYCLNSWQKYGSIIAVQSSDEIDLIQSLFPEVKLEVGSPSQSFSKPTPKITDIISYADEPSLLINSDISIKEFDTNLWQYEEKVLKIGIRHDYFPNNPYNKFKQKYGIDAFLIYPEMRELLPDLDFCIGCPGWDFWLPYHLWFKHDYQIQIPKCRMLHELHPIGWTEQDQKSYRARIQLSEYKLTYSMLPAFILDITNRSHLKAVSWK